MGTLFRDGRIGFDDPKGFLNFSMEWGEKREDGKGNGEGRDGGGLGDKMERGVRVGREMKDKLGMGE